MSEYFLLITAAVAVLAYWIIRVRVADFVQPYRLDVLDRAETLMARADVPDASKRSLEFMLDNIYSAPFAWLVALSYFPFSIYFGLRRYVLRSETSVQKNFPHKKEYQDVMRLGVICTMSSSPIALMLLIVVSLISLALFLPIPRIVNGLADSKVIRSLFHSPDDDHKGQRIANC